MPIERNKRMIATGEIVFANRFPIYESETGGRIGPVVGAAIDAHLMDMKGDGVIQKVTVKFEDDDAL